MFAGNNIMNSPNRTIPSVGIEFHIGIWITHPAKCRLEWRIGYMENWVSYFRYRRGNVLTSWIQIMLKKEICQRCDNMESNDPILRGKFNVYLFIFHFVIEMADSIQSILIFCRANLVVSVSMPLRMRSLHGRKSYRCAVSLLVPHKIPLPSTHAIHALVYLIIQLFVQIRTVALWSRRVLMPGFCICACVCVSAFGVAVTESIPLVPRKFD